MMEHDKKYKKLKHTTSLIAGTTSVAVVGYSLLAPVWGLLYADKIFSTGSILVMILSMILTVFTGEKISRKYSPESLMDSVNNDEVYDDSNGRTTVKVRTKSNK